MAQMANANLYKRVFQFITENNPCSCVEITNALNAKRWSVEKELRELRVEGKVVVKNRKYQPSHSESVLEISDLLKTINILIKNKKFNQLIICQSSINEASRFLSQIARDV